MAPRGLNLSNETESFFRWLLIPSDKILSIPQADYDFNAIRFRNLVIFGSMGSGKSELTRSMLEKVVEFYGEENVNGVYTDTGRIGWMLKYGLDERLVQFLLCDDLTLCPISKEELREWFKIRHHWKRLTGRNTGYVISVLTCHRLFGVPIELRTNADCIIVRNDTLNPYDHSILRRFIGKEGIEDLNEIELKREEDPSHMSYSIFNNRFSKGILNIPMGKVNYLKELGVPISVVYENVLKSPRSIARARL